MKYLIIFIIMTNFTYGLECRTRKDKNGFQNQYIVTHRNNDHFIEYKRLLWRDTILKEEKTILKESATYHSFSSYGAYVSLYSSPNIKLHFSRSKVVLNNKFSSDIKCL